MSMTRMALVLAVPTLLTAFSPITLPVPSEAPHWNVQFNATVYGDFTLVGNTVMSCPRAQEGAVRPKHPPEACAEAQQRKGSGAGALNNSYFMNWSDVDSSDATFNSSSARLSVPAGADVAYAKLGWAGIAGNRAGAPCGTDKAATPPGAPQDQAVSLAVNDGVATRIGPDRFTFTADDVAGLSKTDQQFYSGDADVTKELGGVHGDATVTVGNVWTPRGFDCFGGWSLTVVWKFPGPKVPHAPAKKNIVVYSGYARVPTARTRTEIDAPSLHVAGGPARVGLTAYEGDWATTGDQFLVNGIAQGGKDNAENFFASTAEGSLKPATPNNMSIDVRTVVVSDEVIRPGDTKAQLAFTRKDDAYLVQNLVVSFPKPELTVTTKSEPALAHAGEPVKQSVSVTNTGEAPAREVTLRVGPEPACVRAVGTLAAGATSTVTCDITAAGDDYQSTAKAIGRSAVGDALAAEASSAVEVLRPSVQVDHTADPPMVLQGQQVRFTTTIRNTGDTPLSGIAVRNNRVGECDRTADPLPPGAASTMDCVVTAGEEGGTNTATVIGKDALAREVTAAADAGFSVVHPLLTMSAVWSADRVPRNGKVVITVTVGNPSTVAFTDVMVTGSPAACRRALRTLEPGARTTYTCVLLVESDINAELTATGVPIVNGHALTTDRIPAQVAGSAVVRIMMLDVIAPRPPPRAPAPPPPAVIKTARAFPVSKPAVGGIAAVLAAASMLVVVSATSAKKA